MRVVASGETTLDGVRSSWRGSEARRRPDRQGKMHSLCQNAMQCDGLHSTHDVTGACVTALRLKRGGRIARPLSIGLRKFAAPPDITTRLARVCPDCFKSVATTMTNLRRH